MTLMPSDSPESEQVLAFWFQETDAKQWWAVDSAFDALLTQRFSSLLARAIHGELFSWRATARGVWPK